MKDPFEGVEPAELKSGIAVPYHWWAGDTASRFLTSIRDEKKILGLKCFQCNKVLLPPRKNCPFCFAENKEWIELSNEGTLVTFTVAHRQLAALQQKAPVVFGLIKLDGADTSLLHIIGEADDNELKIGMRVRAVFADDKPGNIMGIKYFKPV